jgi:hypothetical protein
MKTTENTKLIHYKTFVMKIKLLTLLLLFSGISQAQITFINSPSPTAYELCDENTDGIMTFDLNTKTQEIINLVTPVGNYSVVYFQNQFEAENNTNPIVNTQNHQNVLNPAMQTIYFRIINNDDTSDFIVSGMSLVVNPLPFINPNIDDYVLSDTPFDGFAVFNLTTKDSEIGFGNVGTSVSYYPSIADASFGTNLIANPSAYINDSNPQTLGVMVINTSTGCSQVGSFQLIVSNGLPIVTPNEYRICDVGNNTNENFDLTSKNIEILGNLNPSLYTVNYYVTSQDAVNNTNFITNPSSFTLTVTTSTVYVRVFENANPSNFALTNLGLKIVPMPMGTISGPTTVCQGELAIITFQALNSAPPFSFDYSINGVQAGTASASLGNNVSVYINTTNVGTFTYDLVGISSLNETFCYNNQSGSVTVLVQPAPTLASNVPDILVQDTPYDGIATFNLTLNESIILTNQVGATIAYYTSQFAAQAQSSPITNPAVFVANNGQEIWFRLNYPSGCPLISSFNLYTTNPDIVFIPDANFKTLLLNSVPNGGIATDTSFQPILVDINQDNEIQFSEALLVHAIDIYDKNISTIQGIEAFTNLVWFRCTKNNLTSVDLSSNVNLDKLQIGENQLTSLDVSMLTNLVWLVCNNNFLTSLNVLPLVNLEEFNCSYNQLTSIDVTTLSNIYTLDMSYNQLSSVDLSGSESVVQLILQNNQLASLDLSNLTNAGSAFLNNNNLSTIDVSPLQSLLSFGISNNQLTTLDLSQNPVLVVANCSNNNIESLNVKNGANEFSIVFDNNPLNFICADEFQIETIQNQLASIGNSNCVVNSYCSFNPGGNYNTITGTVTFDANNNGCDVSDVSQPNFKIRLWTPTDTGASFTNNSGNYNFYTDAGSFSWLADIENPTWFNFSPPTASTLFADNNNNTVNQNFCISANGIHPDVEIVIAPITPARPGFDATYKIVYRNKGNQTLSGNVSFTYEDEVLDFISSSVIPTSLSTGLLSYDYTNLLPFESRSIEITLNVNAPTDTPAVNIGDVLNFSAIINPIAGDENPSDNTFNYNETVVGSYDPNDITCLEGTLVSPVEIGNYLHYNIRFENTGTAPAEFVVVKVEVNEADFDMNSLQIMNSSNPVNARINRNIVEFIFQNIQLQSGGHGNILLKIKSKNNLQVGDEVNKKADIYFDYNFPILTNDAETVFQSLSNPDIENDASILVYPNPSNGMVTINCNNSIKSVQLYDIQGRLLQTNLVNENQTSIDISNQAKGVYFLKIVSEKGIGVQKIVRE